MNNSRFTSTAAVSAPFSGTLCNPLTSGKSEQGAGHASLAERNRANAQRSTGPTSLSGKAVSKLNAVKSGLTGRTVVLPSDDAARYEQHVQNWQDELNPQSARECSLVQSIADAYWRTERIVRLEFALYAQGSIETTDTDGKGSSPTHKEAELATLLKHEKQMRNLSIQESRIRRQREKDMKELQNLQKQRSETVKVSERTHVKTTKTQSDTAAAATPPAERQRSAASGSAYAAASAQNQPNFSTKSGFEFSTAHLRSGLDAKLNLALPKLTKESR